MHKQNCEFWSKHKPTWWQELEEGIITLINSTNNWCVVEETRRFMQLDYTDWLSILHHASWRVIVFKFPWGICYCLVLTFIGLLLLSVLLVSLLSCPLILHDNNNNNNLFYIVPQQRLYELLALYRSTNAVKHTSICYLILAWNNNLKR